MSALKGGYEEGMPLTVNLMKEHPGLRELSLPAALAVGQRSAAIHSQEVPGHDLRNFRRSTRLDRGIVR